MDQQSKGYGQPQQPPQYYSPPPPGNQGYYQQQQHGGQQSYAPQQQYGQQPYYAPQPVPQTVYVQQQPQRRDDNSMCLGCLAALCFCCALDAIF